MSAHTWEQRWHPLRREWVVIAAHRDQRPWIGETVAGGSRPLPRHDPACTLCPGNTRISGVVNPAYDGVFAFDNDHPCVGVDAPLELAAAPGIYRNAPARGLARVVCYDPRHDLRLAALELPAIDALLACWQDQYRELGARSEVRHVLVFENNGEVVGVSNPHPHCQIYATGFVFTTIANEVVHAREHLAAHGRSLWEDVVRSELEDGRRILDSNTHALAFVPYFARYAYETYVGPRRSARSIADLEPAERRDLAALLSRTLRRLDGLWRMPMPYVLALHQAPTDGEDHRGFGCHVEIHPPLRRPGLLKYLAGPEIGGGSFLSDTCPEQKADELRAVTLD